jgi:hypothetical protein
MKTHHTITVHLVPPCQVEDLGLIPSFLCPDDPRPARQQLDDGYRRDGGWRPMQGFSNTKFILHYPGDTSCSPIAYIPFRDEIVTVYPYDIVAVFQADGSFEAARMD